MVRLSSLCFGCLWRLRVWDRRGYRTDIVVVAVPAAPARLGQTRPQGNTALRAIDERDFSRVWPCFGAVDQSCPNRILKNGFPFLRVAFVGSQEVIEETALPRAGRQACLRGNETFEAGHPRTERAFARDPKEQVDVIGHQNVSADGDLEIRGAARIGTEGIVNFFVGQNVTASGSAGGDEV